MFNLLTERRIYKLFLLTIYMAAMQNAVSSQTSMTNLFPKEIQGWKQHGEARLFNGEEIYDYINGAGEIYLSYNFNKVLVQRYANKSYEEMLVEIFDMGTSANAFGIFTYIQYQGEEVDIGQASEYIPGLLCFWKEKFFVCIRVDNETPELRNASLAIGQAIAEAITVDGEKPQIMNYFSEEDFIPKSIRYFFRYEILNYHFYVADKNILNLNEQTPAALTRYNDDKSYLLLVEYPAEENAEQSYNSFIRTYLPDADKTNILQTENGKWTGITRGKNFIIIIFDARDRCTIENKLTTMIRRLSQ